MATTITHSNFMPGEQSIPVLQQRISGETAVFKNCNVCGRELMREDELGMGCCAVCSNEEITTEEENAETTVRMRKGIPPISRSLRLLLEKRSSSARSKRGGGNAAKQNARPSITARKPK